MEKARVKEILSNVNELDARKSSMVFAGVLGVLDSMSQFPETKEVASQLLQLTDNFATEQKLKG
ncbi:hypothetical protein YTCETSXE_CDS0017 [Staphylococcus phage MVC_VPHSA2]|uniref:Phage protein n=1 Tax=Staphylococcus phage MVC_VPHSA1 TaxID=3088876 RepID=A0ABZ0QZA1_9CAUD|nr:hypothetical protein FBHYGVHD_CDS0013 [Staphylococcus phage MVC_VPHSA1]WPF64973.1 hypothetical protein YTCETSXE_CDS0017 [Staphylococcus phage MVC_VPHSA2]